MKDLRSCGGSFSNVALVAIRSLDDDDPAYALASYEVLFLRDPMGRMRLSIHAELGSRGEGTVPAKWRKSFRNKTR